MTDVNNFHLINDYWGYETGTNILNFILKKLELFPQTLFVNRYHSDIFVCVIDITGQEHCRIKEKLIQYNKQTAREVLDNYPVNYLSLNAGIYYLENAEIPGEEIISHTNIVRLKAKSEITGVCEYTAEIYKAELKRADTIHSFKEALTNKEFQIYFQPKISGKEQKIASA